MSDEGEDWGDEGDDWGEVNEEDQGDAEIPNNFYEAESIMK